MSVIQIILIATIVIVCVGVLFAFVMSQENARKQRAMRVIQGQSGGAKKDDPKALQDKRRAEIAKKLKETKDEDGGDDKKKTPISMQIEQAGLNMSMTQFWIMSAVSMVIFVLAAKLMGHGIVVMLLAAVIGFFGFPKFILKKKAAKRQKNFLQEFPDALEATVRLLKAGMPVAEAVHMIANEYEGPVGEEMSRIYDKQKIGIPLHEAAFEATRRMPLTEMQMFATGLAIQAQTGSSLSEILINLSNVIRARFRLKRKIKALSSEAIASASIIGSLPNLVALGMYFANREYLMVLFETTTGNYLLIGAVVWMMIGIFMMKAMINFKI